MLFRRNCNILTNILKRNDSLCYIQSSQLRTVVGRKKLPIPLFEKRLDIVIMGAPNAGKSVLLNTFLRQKLAATSRKRHTTRTEILGVFNHRNTQLAFYDTPGFVGSNFNRKKDMIGLTDITIDSCRKADVILLVVDASKKFDGDEQLAFAEMAKIAINRAQQEVILVLNKIDLVKPKSILLEITRLLVSIINGIKYKPDEIDLAQLDTTTYMISSLNNDGVLDLKNYLISNAKVKEWVIKDRKSFTDLTLNDRVIQIVLENLLDHTHDEIPFIAIIDCTKIEEYNDKILKVYVSIKVDNQKQQKICIGYQGRTMLKIRQNTSNALERILNKTVLVYLNIAIKGKSDESIEEIDY